MVCVSEVSVLSSKGLDISKNKERTLKAAFLSKAQMKFDFPVSCLSRMRSKLLMNLVVAKTEECSQFFGIQGAWPITNNTQFDRVRLEPVSWDLVAQEWELSFTPCLPWQSNRLHLVVRKLPLTDRSYCSWQFLPPIIILSRHIAIAFHCKSFIISSMRRAKTTGAFLTQKGLAQNSQWLSRMLSYGGVPWGSANNHSTSLG